MITANFNAYNKYVTDTLHQWDLNRVLQVTGLNLTAAPEVHFSNANTDRAIVRQATMTNHVVSVNIPNSLLQDPLRIKAHIGIYEGDEFKVVELVEIPVEPRKRPLDYQIDAGDEEVYSFKRLENMLENAATKAQVANIVAGVGSDAELVDLRYSADGKTYASAGEAVRAQILTAQRASGIAVGADNYTDHFTDADNAPNGNTYFIRSNVTADMVANLPEYGAYGALTTVNYAAADVHGKYQLFVTAAGNFHWRFEQGSDAGLVWTKWNSAMRQGLDVAYSAKDCFAVGKSDSVDVEVDAAELTLTVKDTTTIGAVWTANKYLFVVELQSKAISLVVGETNTYFVYIRGNELKLEKTAAYVAEKDDIILSQLYLHSSGRVVQNIWTLGNTEKTVAAHDSRIAALENTTNKNTCAIFARVCCCGDSYTSGHIDTGDGATETNEKFAWPSFLARLTGNDYVNCGKSGANVLTWQTNERGLPKAQAAGKVQAYLVGFGLNDASTGTSRYVAPGTPADIGTTASTYYGGLSKIIRELHAISPKAMIFVQTIPSTAGVYTEYNTAIRDIAAAYADSYNVHLLDLYAYRDMYQADGVKDDHINAHYTAIGYQQFAEILRVIWSDYINQHLAAFQNVHLIEYDE